MMSPALAAHAVASDWTPVPVRQGVLQRQSGRLAELDLAAPGIKAGLRDHSRRPSIGGARTGGLLSDFSQVPAYAASDVTGFGDDSSTSAGVAPTSLSTTASPTATGVAPQGTTEPQNLTGNAPAQLQQGQGTPINGKVTNLDVITSSTGAVTGFPAITGGGSLDSPGPFNDTTTGSCKNIHQMKFTIAGIPSNEFGLLRMVDRTATAAGHKHVHKGKDGPSPATVLRPSASLAAVADSPGYIGHGHSADFPVTYNADFKLYGFDIVSKTILAELDYKVAIAKSTVADAKPTNQITVTKKVLK